MTVMITNVDMVQYYVMLTTTVSAIATEGLAINMTGIIRVQLKLILKHFLHQILQNIYTLRRLKSIWCQKLLLPAVNYFPSGELLFFFFYSNEKLLSNKLRNRQFQSICRLILIGLIDRKFPQLVLT